MMLPRTAHTEPERGGAAALEQAKPATLVCEDMKLPGSGTFPRQARLVFEPDTNPERLLILLHGRGEADSVGLALKAWSHLYGMCESYARLKTPPLTAVSKQPRWEEARASEMNASLRVRPFQGFAVICPVTPNPAAFGDRTALYRAYSEWLVTDLAKTVRQRLPSVGKRIGLDGCSMGGALAFELFLERPSDFRSFGTVQAAIGTERAKQLARRFKALAASQALPRLHLLTSSGDPYRQAIEQLHYDLRGSDATAASLEVIAGPHNQPWLRQMGTLAMLLWHDRVL